MDWKQYLVRGSGVSLYHMCDKAAWDDQIAEKGSYIPPTYAADGFIHATGEPAFLIDVANHFYKSTEGDWICLKIDPNSLGASEVKWEAPAPVGETEAYDHNTDGSGEATDQPKFPHIYGPIPAKSVIGFYIINRAADGTFLNIQGITD
jgi:uncharacterized protein (DUF952 family)